VFAYPANSKRRQNDFERARARDAQSVVELGTEICGDAHVARQQVVELRTELAKLAACDGLKIASTGTHPFSHWIDQLITVHERYATIVKDTQQIARANLIFGLHVHVGIPNREGKRVSAHRVHKVVSRLPLEHSARIRGVCSQIRNHPWQERGAQRVQDCEDINHFLSERAGDGTQMTGGRDEHPDNAQGHSA
jgi:Glutamate-cysteine ligase family 2(GCS2)